jgi:hypothetical protein
MSDWNDTRGALHRIKKTNSLDQNAATAPRPGGVEDVNAKRALRKFALEIREDPSLSGREYLDLQKKRLDDFVYGSAEIIRKEHEPTRGDRPTLQRRPLDGIMDYNTQSWCLNFH